jgi:hypothetical protein
MNDIWHSDYRVSVDLIWPLSEDDRNSYRSLGPCARRPSKLTSWGCPYQQGDLCDGPVSEVPVLYMCFSLSHLRSEMFVEWRRTTSRYHTQFCINRDLITRSYWSSGKVKHWSRSFLSSASDFSPSPGAAMRFQVFLRFVQTTGRGQKHGICPREQKFERHGSHFLVLKTTRNCLVWNDKAKAK